MGTSINSFFGRIAALRGARGFLGSESKFIVPLAHPPGAMLCIVMKLASDPNNPAPVPARPSHEPKGRCDTRLALHPENLNF